MIFLILLIIIIFLSIYFLIKYIKNEIKKNRYDSFNIFLNLQDKKLDSALIVEPRNHMALESVIINIYENTQVPIIIFHGNKNIDMINVIINKYTYIQFKIYNLKIDNLTIDDYNNLLLTEEFWDKASIYGNKILLFQTDSGICNAEYLNKFTNYDYCGALWNRFDIQVGNGGFSIRDTYVMKDIIKKYISNYPLKIFNGNNEDVFFAYYITKYYSICPKYIAEIFSSEYKTNKKSFGFHKKYNICEFSKKIKNLQ